MQPLPRFRCATLFLALLVAGGPAFASGVVAGEGPEQERPRETRPRHHGRSDDHRALSDAVRRAERATGGQVLSAERVQYDGRDLNRVKVVDDRGRVRVFWDDPQSRGREAPPQPERPQRPTRDDDGASD